MFYKKKNCSERINHLIFHIMFVVKRDNAYKKCHVNMVNIHTNNNFIWRYTTVQLTTLNKYAKELVEINN